MASIAALAAAISLIKELKNIADDVSDNYAACKLICTRVGRCEETLQRQHDKIQHVSSSDKHIEEFISALKEAKMFAERLVAKRNQKKNSDGVLDAINTSIANAAARVDEFVKYSDYKRKIEKLQKRIDQSIADLQLDSTINNELRRQEDFEALMKEMNAHYNHIISHNESSIQSQELSRVFERNMTWQISQVQEHLELFMARMGYSELLNSEINKIETSRTEMISNCLKVDIQKSKEKEENDQNKRKDVSVRRDSAGKRGNEFCIQSSKVSLSEEMVAKLAQGEFDLVTIAKYGGKPVAVKVVCNTEEEALREEIAACQCVLHPNIINIYGYCKRDANMLVLMELATQGSLWNLISNSTFYDIPFPLILAFFGDISSGIEHLHHKGIVHGNLTPRNILICNNDAKIVYFGRNAILESPETADYIAPEWNRDGKTASARSDVYSFGVLMLDALDGLKSKGKPIGERIDLLSQHSSCPESRLHELCFVLRGSTAYNKDERFFSTTVWQLIMSLLNILGGDVRHVYKHPCRESALTFLESIGRCNETAIESNGCISAPEMSQMIPDNVVLESINPCSAVDTPAVTPVTSSLDSLSSELTMPSSDSMVPHIRPLESLSVEEVAIVFNHTCNTVVHELQLTGQALCHIHNDIDLDAKFLTTFRKRLQDSIQKFQVENVGYDLLKPSTTIADGGSVSSCSTDVLPVANTVADKNCDIGGINSLINEESANTGHAIDTPEPLSMLAFDFDAINSVEAVIEALTAVVHAPPNADVAMNIMDCMYRLCDEIIENQQSFIDSSRGMEFLLKLFQDHKTDSACTIKALILLKLFSSFTAQLCYHGACEYIALVMQLHISNVEIIINGCAAIWDIATLASNPFLLSKGSAIMSEVVISGMGRYMDNEHVSEHGYKVLSVLARYNDVYQMLSYPKTMEVLIAVMKSQYRNRNVARFVCTAFMNVDGIAAAASEGIELIVNAMALFSKDANVISRACGALGNLAVDSSIQDKISELHGIKAVVTALEDHKDDVSVAEYGCMALFNIAENHPNNKAQLLSNRDIIQTIIAVMKPHAAVEKVVQQACGVLALLSNADDSVAEQLWASGGIEAIIAAMTDHVSNVFIADYGCSTLANFVANVADRKTRVIEAGGVAAVIRVMHMHDGDPAVAECGCLALANIQDQIYAVEGIKVAMKALQNHKSNADVVVSGCRAFLMLFDYCAWNIEDTFCLECLETIVAVAMCNSLKDKVVALFCTNALAVLSGTSMTEKLQSTEWIEAIMDGMMLHCRDAENADIAWYGCIAVSNFVACCSGRNGETVQRKCCDTLIEVLRWHDSHADVVQCGYKALTMLASSEVLLEKLKSHESMRTILDQIISNPDMS